MYRGWIAAIILVLVSLTSAQAQGRFSPVLQVGENVVTRYQIDQRTLFLTLLGAPGDVRELAREQLINETVQFAAAEAADISPNEEEVAAGMEEFAARANLTAEQFTTALGQNGVEAQTFRDFIGAGVAWRNYVRDQFGEAARATVSETQIARALAQTGTEGGLRVLISEILLPKNTPETALASRARAAELSNLRTEEEFAAAAREFSVSSTAQRGGEVNWVDIETLPEVIRPVIARMTPGQISRPVELETSVGVFLMRDIERVAAGTPETLLTEYAIYTASSPEDAARVQAEIDVCDDLYGVAKGLPENRLLRETEPSTQLPADIRAAFANLDAGESTVLTRGGRTQLVMLCERRPAQESTVDLTIVGNRLLNARLGTTAINELANLRAETIVIDLTQ